MRRSTGAIFLETRPETIITSACRGEARKTSAPNRARSLRELVTFIISIAQQARPNVAGHKEDLRAHLMSESRRVVSTSGSASAMMFSSPMVNHKPLLKPAHWRARPGYPADALRLLHRVVLVHSSRMRLS